MADKNEHGFAEFVLVATEVLCAAVLFILVGGAAILGEWALRNLVVLCGGQIDGIVADILKWTKIGLLIADCLLLAIFVLKGIIRSVRRFYGN